MTTQTTHEKFTNIRKRLDQLGYKQPLSLDCLPLVERLFCDLVWTTESLRKAKADLSSQLKLRSNVEDYIAPYKADNGRLVRENNELHKQLVLLRQESEEKFRSFKSEYRRLENESTDLKIFNTQCIEKLRNYESDARRMAEQIMTLQEKNFQAVVYTPGGQKKQLPFRRQRMDIDSLFPRADIYVKTSGDNFPKSKHVVEPEVSHACYSIVLPLTVYLLNCFVIVSVCLLFPTDWFITFRALRTARLYVKCSVLYY
ncbi:hypothetical protein PHET_08625 [Paragonimus heterotremus]|uniref:Uncharacterized protein n=1 Tax=Paragonimus heterotremus TaxID=100268 RepID=A0A8J4WF10_9TREM|nr:hypothetical protein PHET_08625 [Paragonimus heterotremus]